MPEQQPRPSTSPIESLAIATALLSAAVAFGAVLLIQQGRLAPLGGSGSVAAIALPVIAVTSATAFIWAYVRHADGGLRWRLRHPLRRVLDVLGLTLTGVGVAVLIVASMFEVFLLARRGPGGRNLRGVTVIRIALATVGIALSGLGIVPVDVSVPVHNTFSTLALSGFSGLIVLTPVLLKGLPPAFIVATVVFAALIVLGVVLFALGDVNLTALELIAVLVIFTWLILFTRNASVGRRADEPAETP